MAPNLTYTGYVPGAIGRVTELHAHYYHANWDFDLFFEAKVATELAEFLGRYDETRDFFRVALLDDRIVGSVSVDGSRDDPDGPRLRWFIVAPEAQGKGVGRRLMSEALTFARQAGLGRLHLWTFAGLDAAAHVYEAAGFRLAREHTDEQWGRTVHELMYVLDL